MNTLFRQFSGDRNPRVMAGRFLPIVLLFLALLPSAVLASIHIEDDCGQFPCTCFLQEGDEGIAVQGVINLLKQQKYLSSSPSVYTSDVARAVKQLQAEYGLEQTGMLDDDSLTCLIWGMTADELDIAQPSSNPDQVWIPTNGGKKRHSRPTCSKMISPRKVSVRNADALGLDPCGKCKPN